MTQSRQLAAIMFTDIVGYTALMGKDEDKAFQSLSQFKSIAQPLVEKYYGHWHKDLGDGALMSFSNVLDAVHCAIAVQKEINSKSDFRLRMGIHLGDVTFKDGDVFGDGVNIASRLQNEAPVGGISISEPVFKNIQNKEGIGTQYLGRKKLKNVLETVRLWQIKVEGVQTKATKTSSTVSWPVVMGLVVTSSLLTGILVRNAQSGSNLISTANFRAVHRTILEFPEEAPLALVGSAPSGIGWTALTLSPDGSHLVYVAQVDSMTTKLYLHPMDGFTFSQLEGTDGAYYPFFSPDGQWICFFAEKELKKVSIKGGNPITICGVSLPNGAYWANKEDIVFSNNEGKNIMRVSANGGKPEAIFDKKRKYGSNISCPFPLSEGENIVFTNGGQLFVSSLILDSAKSLNVMGTNPVFLSTGHLVYADFGRLMAVRFDMKSLKLNGSPFPVIESVRTEIMQKAAQMSFAENGTLIYIPGSAANLSNFFWADRKGNTELIDTKADIYGTFALSPDGNKIAYGKTRGRIGIIDITEKKNTEIALDIDAREPVWSPDGAWIAYVSLSNKESQLSRIRLGHTSKPELLFRSEGRFRPYSYLKDGTSISIFRGSIENIFLNSPGKVETLVDAMPYTSYGASFSPDQRYFTYTTDESGRYEVYVQPYPTTGEKWQISTEGGFDVLWSPTGKEIIYRGPNQLFSVAVKTDSGFSFRKPQVVFKGQFLDAPQRSFDVSPDGRRFLMLTPVNKTQTAKRAIVVTNWFEEIKKLTPMK